MSIVDSPVREKLVSTPHPFYPTIDSKGRITRASRITAFIFVHLLPTLAIITAAVLAFNGMVSKLDLGILAVMYLVTGIGITVGYHRLFTHRAFETSRPVKYTLAVLGCMSAEGAPIIWAAQHRQHHATSDQEGDPHSPYVGRRPGFLGALRAIWHGHYGHVFNQVAAIDPERYTPDLERDPFLRWLEKWSALAVVAGFLIPGAAAWLITGSWLDALTGVLWGGLVRLFLITHATGSVNSLCHYFGSQRFDTGDQSGNVAWLMPITLGESWHHNHHAFPTSARHGLKWWEFDPSWIVILILEKLHLVHGVIRIKPEHILQRQRA